MQSLNIKHYIIRCRREETVLRTSTIEATLHPMMRRTEHLKGMVLMTGAGLSWSTGGILIRSTTLPNAWEVVFWRALFMTIFVTVFLTLRYRGRILTQISAVGGPGLMSGVLLASAFFFFILSVMRTT